MSIIGTIEHATKPKTVEKVQKAIAGQVVPHALPLAKALDATP